MTVEPPQRRSDIPAEMGEFICPFCGRQYPTGKALHAHVGRTHRSPPELR